jgi:hypothetical protein
MDVAQLPGPGPDFRLDDSLGGFRRKLSDQYKNIRNDIDLIIDTIRPYEEIIKRGGLDHAGRLHIWDKIRVSDRALSRWDMELVTQILERLSR